MTFHQSPQRAVDESALYQAVYAELKVLARRQLRREDRPSLCTTDLVHEAFLRLSPGPQSGWENRAHFFGAAARAMRQIMVDFARRRRAAKRNGSSQPVSLSAAEIGVQLELDDMLALDAAMEQLEAADPRLHHVVELRFFGGMAVPDIASMTGMSTRTVERHWLKARLFLLDALASEPRRRVQEGTSPSPDHT